MRFACVELQPELLLAACLVSALHTTCACVSSSHQLQPAAMAATESTSMSSHLTPAAIRKTIC